MLDFVCLVYLFEYIFGVFDGRGCLWVYNDFKLVIMVEVLLFELGNCYVCWWLGSCSGYMNYGIMLVVVVVEKVVG